MLTLTKRHTGMATPRRLHMCIRDPESGCRGGSGVSENDVGAATGFFVDSGVYYRVMPLQVARVSLHAWTPTNAMRANLFEHVVLRRGTMEDLLLSLLLESTASAWTAVTIADKLRGRTPPASRAEPVCTLAAFPDSLLRGPAVLPTCGVTGSSQRRLTLRVLLRGYAAHLWCRQNHRVSAALVRDTAAAVVAIADIQP
ncbi:hypothetical protein Q4I28_000833 [Leishmania naiffi]|uniref:Uncharacterized protein n=1 Tax=Leishmania naiffi TaxID=5678 RepID=A0AAW3C6C1_9TRYP